MFPQNVFLPTMPQDHLAEVRKAGGVGTFYGEFCYVLMYVIIIICGENQPRKNNLFSTNLYCSPWFSISYQFRNKLATMYVVRYVP